MSVRIVLVAEVGYGREPMGVPGMFLAAYDPEAHGGCGSAAWTDDPAGAMTFADARAAYECYRKVPRNCPVRPDGKPNRPLTSATVIIERVPEAGA